MIQLHSYTIPRFHPTKLDCLPSTLSLLYSTIRYVASKTSIPAFSLSIPTDPANASRIPTAWATGSVYLASRAAQQPNDWLSEPLLALRLFDSQSFSSHHIQSISSRSQRQNNSLQFQVCSKSWFLQHNLESTTARRSPEPSHVLHECLGPLTTPSHSVPASVASICGT